MEQPTRGYFHLAWELSRQLAAHPITAFTCSRPYLQFIFHHGCRGPPHPLVRVGSKRRVDITLQVPLSMCLLYCFDQVFGKLQRATARITGWETHLLAGEFISCLSVSPAHLVAMSQYIVINIPRTCFKVHHKLVLATQ